MNDAETIYQHAKKHAVKALDADRDGDVRQAAEEYLLACKWMLKGTKLDPHQDRAEKMKHYVIQYNARASQLEKQLAKESSSILPATPSSSSPSSPPKSKVLPYSEWIRTADHHEKKGQECRTKGRYNDARKSYRSAAESLMKAMDACQDDKEKAKLRARVEKMLRLAETMHKAVFGTVPSPSSSPSTSRKNSLFPSVPDDSAPSPINPSDSSSGGKNEDPFLDIGLPDAPSDLPQDDEVFEGGFTTEASRIGGGSIKFTKEEAMVLRATSNINSEQYLPWIKDDEKEKFRLSTPFKDPSGALALASQQKRHFAHWRRPESIHSDPNLIVRLSSRSVKQTVISDCSFVSSLAISADYETRFKRRLITECFYPKNRDGQPVISPSGKYVFKLHFNGVWRKVVIDDFLPVDSNNTLLCSFSANPSEFWISLIEKAYMKVMGGYDFPGSNSAVDLHALTGWIPDRLPVKKMDDNMWGIILKGFHKGSALLTAATGQLSEDMAERTGLVPTHAYAILDLRLIDGVRLLKLKNPWSHLIWKGNYSVNDDAHWTPELQKKLSYDISLAKKNDHGEFWIDWHSFSEFFEVIYLNWTPKAFSHVSTYHHCWEQGKGPVKDIYNMQANPQYALSITNSKPADVWVLLTRHITEVSDFADNKEYITTHVFTGNDRILYPENPYILGTKINSPHYLTKLKLEPGQHKFTCVVSQYEKSSTINFSLKVYATCPFKMAPLKDPYINEVKIIHKWDEHSAGGSFIDKTSFQKNPHFTVGLPSNAEPQSVLIKLEAPKRLSVGLHLYGPGIDELRSGAYRPGFCYVAFNAEPGKRYTIIPSTFNKGETGTFFMKAGAKTAPKLSLST